MDPTRKAEYERAVLAELRGLLDPDRMIWARSPEGEGRARLREVDHFWDRVKVEKVELDTSGPEHEVVVSLRDPTRLGGLSEWRTPAVEPGTFKGYPVDKDKDLKNAAQARATVLLANLQEDVLTDRRGYPKDCPPWF